MTQIEQIKAEIERLIEEAFDNIKDDSKRSMVSDVANSRQIAVCKQLLTYINSLPAEQPSEEFEGLEDSIIEFLGHVPENEPDHSETLYTYEQMQEIARHFANWQKEQMMKGLCYETKVYRDEEGDGIDTPIESWLALENNEITNLPNIGLKEGDKVKILIVKEDEQ